MRHLVEVGLGLVEKPLLLHQRDDALAGREAVEAVQRQRRLRHLGAIEEIGIVAQRQLAEAVEDADQRKIMAPADLEVVEVVAGCDLHRAGPLLGIRIFVGDDRDASPDQRQHHLLAHEARHSARPWD